MADKTAPKQRGRPFRKGVSGNPSGCPQGSRHRTTLMAEALIEKDAEDIVQAVIASAKAGDPTSMRLCLERLVPVRKGRAIQFEIPPINTASDVTNALGSVVAQMANGDISPDEATSIAAVLEIKRKAIETTDIENRLAAIEGKLESKKS